MPIESTKNTANLSTAKFSKLLRDLANAIDAEAIRPAGGHISVETLRVRVYPPEQILIEKKGIARNFTLEWTELPNTHKNQHPIDSIRLDYD